ncbi:MAG TPA: universal stress protein [Ktedonobacteraceae bacterium]|nr:universal stress protein [Ktedonobacteraceae bacterium]
MFQDILVPLDGSSRAEQVLPVAARLAQITDGTVSLLQAVWPPSVYMASVGEVVLPDILDETVPAAKEYLESVAKKSSLEGVRTETQVVIGHPAEAIIAASNADNTDLIVMCSHGHTGEMRWSMGSIAEKVARHVSSPVLILYEDCALLEEIAAIPRSSVRILVPLDGSQHAEVAVAKAAMLATAISAQGELHLTHVVSSRGNKVSSIDEELEKARHYLRTFRDRMQHHMLSNVGVSPDLAYTWSVTMADDVASGIMQAAEGSARGKDAVGCQVIAMTARGRSGQQLWSLGSTTERVLQSARQPLFIVHG